ncbi:MT-A70-domain-containing protein [Xylariomycetidae sp. FL2044]|nr:MT-A70-domain-containing protein [Xylariomycetidae sp. FL2044]
MESSVIFEAEDRSVVVIDIPRSIEEAQVLPGQALFAKRLISSKPIDKPWKTPEPKNGRQQKQLVSPAAAISELMTLERVRSALETVRASHADPWCLPRITRAAQNAGGEGDTGAGDTQHRDQQQGQSRKRKRPASEQHADSSSSASPLPNIVIPPNSHHLQGTIASQRHNFLSTAPRFDLIILDPPWPSRSARRKRTGDSRYAVVRDVGAARDLLLEIPVAARLRDDGLVAVWITNKASVEDVLLTNAADGDHGHGDGGGGVFARWGLEPVAEWVWLKVTSAGEPVVGLSEESSTTTTSTTTTTITTAAAWRRPWERLLIARRKGSRVPVPPSRVLLGVPDAHSRKPNLRAVFADVLPAGYLGLEVFARNLTAGWWSWGDQVLLFQRDWVDGGSGSGGGESDSENDGNEKRDEREREKRRRN